jgi:hypothetical protein
MAEQEQRPIQSRGFSAPRESSGFSANHAQRFLCAEETQKGIPVASAKTCNLACNFELSLIAPGVLFESGLGSAGAGGAQGGRSLLR